jgi:2,5-dioxopentanoate dehydrogenase
MFEDASPEQINMVMEQAWNAFLVYRKCSVSQRANLLKLIAKEIDDLGDDLIRVAAEETHLTEARLKNEKTRTLFQLISYAEACENGSWIETRIDKPDPKKNPLKPYLKKTMIPLGPVIVFGAANFPFAYSTAGGDTASALAAGCPVIVKAHPAHPRTSEMVAGAIMKACANAYMPAGLFAHVYGESFEVGKALVEHPRTKAVGFTGSLAGGRQLFDWANQRKEPIPVFAEMSSINPVFLFPGKMVADAKEVAKLYAGSITLGTGQFCTNPGLIIGIDNEDLKVFTGELSEEIRKMNPADMLHAGIFKNYVERRANALAQEEVEMLAVSETEPIFNQGTPTIASVSAQAFLHNPLLHQEVFGPYSLLVRCRDMQEMIEVSKNIEGQLTVTAMATAEDIRNNEELIDNLTYLSGRFILNGVPTGVEVSWAMHHGGPYPATTDSRFTSVGPDAIKRFARPVCFQNWPE